MREWMMAAALWFSAIGCGLIGGLYFAFSAFLMTALHRLPPSGGIAAMNAINSEILRSLFIPLFLATSLVALLLSIAAAFSHGEAGAVPTFIGGSIYVVGMFVVTMAFNVPLNNALAALDASTVEAGETWIRYVREWTLWNHLRTVACLSSATLFTVAIAVRAAR